MPKELKTLEFSQEEYRKLLQAKRILGDLRIIVTIQSHPTMSKRLEDAHLGMNDILMKFFSDNSPLEDEEIPF